MDRGCIHHTQHIFKVGKVCIQYCVQCKEICWKWEQATGKDLPITEKDQKLAKQHRCVIKIARKDCRKIIDNE